MRKETRISLSSDAPLVLLLDEARNLAIGADDDGIVESELASIIRESSQFVGKLVGYPLAKSEKTELFERWPVRCYELLPQNAHKEPTTEAMFSEMTVSYADSESRRQTLAQSDWTLDLTHDPPRIWLAEGFSRPALASRVSLPVEVSYVFDPLRVPEPLKGAVSEVFRYRFESRLAGTMFSAGTAASIVSQFVIGYRRKFP